jgi:hypothetical protein
MSREHKRTSISIDESMALAPSLTNKPAPRPLAIPLRTSENWRPSVAG